MGLALGYDHDQLPPGPHALLFGAVATTYPVVPYGLTYVSVRATHLDTLEHI